MNNFYLALIITIVLSIIIYLYFKFTSKELISEDGDIEITLMKLRVSEQCNDGSHAKLPPIENKGKND